MGNTQDSQQGVAAVTESSDSIPIVNAGTNMYGLDCDVCYDTFNSEDRRPKNLPCGHTYCLKCLKALKASSTVPLCPKDQSKINLPADLSQLQDNFYVLSLVTDDEYVRKSERRKLRQWCTDCGAEATSACERHFTMGLFVYRKDVAAGLVAALQRRQRARLALQELQRSARQSTEGMLGHQEALQDTVQDTLAGLQEGRDDPWDALVAQAKRLLEDESGTTLDEDLNMLESEHSALVRSAGWEAEEVPLQDNPVLALAMLLLRRQGLLKRREPQQQQNQQQQQQPLEMKITPGGEMDLSDLRKSGPNEHTELKRKYLESNVVVRAVRRLTCNRDDTWASLLLQRHGGSLELLELGYPGRRQLELVLEAMPQLRRLDLKGCQETLHYSSQLKLPSCRAASLQWLRAADLPKLTLLAVLVAVREQLLDLELVVGPLPYGAPESWPDTCSDLPALLRAAQLPRLRSLTLHRPKHPNNLCVAQVTGVHRVLPSGCRVICNFCKASSTAP